MTTKLPVAGFKALGKGWCKFSNMMRYGRVTKELAHDPVQQIGLVWTGASADARQTVDDSLLEELAQACTEGAPSCTMRVSKTEEETRSGPLFNLQVWVQMPGKQPHQEARHVCVSKDRDGQITRQGESTALLEKHLPRESKLVENYRFMAHSKRILKLRDMEEAQGAADHPGQQKIEEVAPRKAASFRWRGRDSVVAKAGTQPRDPSAPLQQTSASNVSAYGWRRRCILTPEPGAAPCSTLPTAGTKRGREEEEEHVQLASHAKRIKIGPILVPG